MEYSLFTNDFNARFKYELSYTRETLSYVVDYTNLFAISVCGCGLCVCTFDLFARLGNEALIFSAWIFLCLSSAG